MPDQATHRAISPLTVVPPLASGLRDDKAQLEQRLSSVLIEFARNLATDFPIQTILDHLVVRIAAVLPVTAAGVTLISPGKHPRYVAASDESALRYEELQNELAEGPCVLSYKTGEAVSIPDLRVDDRFAQFTQRAIAEGVVAVFTFPLRHGEEQLGALDLYRTTEGALSDREMVVAQILADVVTSYLVNAQSRIDLKEASARALALSLHDDLTGLPNRSLLIERLDHAVLRCRRSNRFVAILFADLDRFKEVNDTHGHPVGDALLTAVAQRLTALLRPGDTLARLAGDEFIILCEDLVDPSQVEPLAKRIGLALAEPFLLSGTKLHITASVGIAFSGRGNDVPAQILQDADTAMYQAKRKGGARHGVIDLREQRQSADWNSLNRDLRGALVGGQLRLDYQPIVETVGGRVRGVEALLRWSHPTLGIVAPEKAVALAEQSGLISEIGEWVLERACLDRHRWQRRSRSHLLEVAVNVSAHQLMAPGFPAVVDQVLQSTKTEPGLVTLEVTEGVFLKDAELALSVLNELKELGVLLALDDFGTGYSSLSYLKQFPVDIVKIDKSFVADLDHDLASGLIVGAIVGLAHGLGTRVVAEGVESFRQYQQLAALDCDAYQGYFFGRPASADSLDALFAGAVA